MVAIEDFCVEKHLAYIMQAGLNTQEFATGDKIIFWSEGDLKNWAAEKNGSMLVALNQDMEILGFLLAIFDGERIATLENIHVREGFRKQGIASKLLNEFENRAIRAGIKTLRSFCHTTNTAMSNLLTQHHYSEGILTQWYVNQPKLVNCESEEGGFQIKKIGISDVGQAMYANFLSILISDLNHQDTPILDFAQVIHGAFLNDSLVGLVTTSAHKPTSKATIERIFIDRSKEASVVIKSLILSSAKYLAMQDISCVTIHPFTEINVSLDLMASLDTLGFKKRRVFVMNLKSVKTSNDKEKS
jgi:ribosomal protein S18 acetylase RimI-like enzyme